MVLPIGKTTDYGDLIHVETWVVKGRRLHGVFHLGPPITTTFWDRHHSSGATPVPATGRIDIRMDLQADKKVPLSVQWTDEMGNPVADAPIDAVITYTTDAPSVLNMTDNGDGTAWAAATGALGAATVHMEATAPGMMPITGDLMVMVVAGLAERAMVMAGDAVEVTPDDVPAPPL